MHEYRRPTGAINALLAFALICFFPGTLWADAPRDIPTNQRLWLDGLDVNTTDTGNGGGTNPANGAQVTAWKDKSPNGYTAGDAVSYGTYAHTLPTYSTGSGVSFDGVSNALEVTGGVYPLGSTVTNSDIFIVASTRNIELSSLLYVGLADSKSTDYRINFHAPWTGGNYIVHHGTINAALNVSWSGSGANLNQTYLYNIGSNSGTSEFLARDGANLGTLSATTSFVQQSGSSFFIGSGGTTYGGVRYESYHDGLVSEVIVYSRRLNTAEKNILQSYLAAKYANPGGAGTANRYTVTGAYSYHVGGIGQESDGSLTVGTSAGLTIGNSNFLGNGKYLVAGTDSLNPSKGVSTSELPAGYTARAARNWYLTRTGNGGGSANFTFNLAQLGVTANSGAQMALFYRSSATGAYTAAATATYNGSGSIAFTLNSPQSGYYTLGGSMTAAAIGAPTISLSLSNALISDGVYATNFKMIPGALLHTSAVVTNSGTGSPDADTAILSFSIQPNTKLFVGDLAGAGSGPVQFTQGTTSSGLTYSYTSLASTTDRLDFSSDSGATWTYVPTPDAQQADAAVTNLRVRLGGTFANGVSPNLPSFTVKYGLVIK